ncbi:hypothetical protein [Pectinatus frisingensis]|uniref:hypothetical protein n=1 Tax=Pectinatus frisingensis TaxID=865 RepID=UPI0018C5DD89|nr:hypothetical protein [Pectinatus frisingensis]
MNTNNSFGGVYSVDASRVIPADVGNRLYCGSISDTGKMIDFLSIYVIIEHRKRIVDAWLLDFPHIIVCLKKSRLIRVSRFISF